MPDIFRLMICNIFVCSHVDIVLSKVEHICSLDAGNILKSVKSHLVIISIYCTKLEGEKSY